MFLLPFHVVGCSIGTHDLATVGRLRLDEPRLHALHEALAERAIPAVLLSTCHRTELFWWGNEELDGFFAEQVVAGRTVVPAVRHDADLAVRHLFAVAAGMRSVRFGEPEVLGQLRQAWKRARDAGRSCAELDDVMRQAVESARQIRQEIGDAADGSLGECVARQVRAFADQRGDAAGPTRLVIVGAGDAARSVLEALTPPAATADHGGGRRVEVAISSRTDARAEALAASRGVQAVPWEARDGAIRAADVVVLAVHTASPLYRAAELDVVVAARRAAPSPADTLWIDLGVPPIVDRTAVPEPMRLLTLEDLEVASAEFAAQRQAAQQRATRRLQHELARFDAALQRRRLVPHLASIEEQARAQALADAPTPSPGEETVPTELAGRVARRAAHRLLRELTVR